MRKPKIVNLFILIVLSQFIVSSCSKENEEELKFVPELGATEVSSVTFSTVSISGSVIGNGNDEVLERGVCWDNSSRIISDAEKIVNQGNGQHTFIVTTAAKDWGSEGDFSAYVNLSENPLPETWTPLTNDRFILIPQK